MKFIRHILLKQEETLQQLWKPKHGKRSRGCPLETFIQHVYTYS